MSTPYVIALLGLFAGLCAVVALVWAIIHRQLMTEDRAMYEAVADDEPDYTASFLGPATTVSVRSRWLFITAFGAIFVTIGWLIVQTVRVSNRVAPTPRVIQLRTISE